jgi:hypothetical protein
VGARRRRLHSVSGRPGSKSTQGSNCAPGGGVSTAPAASGGSSGWPRSRTSSGTRSNALRAWRTSRKTCRKGNN